ncbi:cell filamentation protein Fic [Bacteroidia bacterium]|nr:cell filamentation protein Fic [Bacteroidia bacterium]
MNEFEEYIRQGEPDRVEKTQIWQTAIGLQQVDGLTPSAYLIATAKENIEGKITINEVKSRIDTYYKTLTVRNSDDDRTEEADKVSARIAEVLGEKTFTFSYIEFINIHKRLFGGTYKFAGKVRDYDISKNEWVLNGKSVMYASAYRLRNALEHDFNQEKAFDYKGLTPRETVEHIAKFISNIWQAHVFGEGNTRTTAVFAIKYLRTFGFEVENDMFAQHSWYFRNALVRANYKDTQNNIYATQEYLMRFLGNVLFGENNELKNRQLHIQYVAPQNDTVKDGAKDGVNVTNNITDVTDNVTDNVTDRTSKIIALIKENNRISATKMATALSVSKRTILRDIDKLKQSRQICRIGDEKTGYWKLIINH